MLTQFRLLENVGQFQSTSSPATSPLRHYVLVYAENGRGKTTLSAIFHSLASGDPIRISERRRLGAAANPHVVLVHDAMPPPFIFQNGAWNRTLPDLLIFDDRFVDENVHSGLTVEASHRQSLHQLVIGANGVALNKQHQECVSLIETHITELRTRETAIPAQELGGYPIDIFCNLPDEPDVEVRIQNTAQSFEAAREQDRIRMTVGFSAVQFPDFDSTSVEQVVMQTLDTLNTATVVHVQQHFQSLGRGGETWAQDGMNRVVHSETGDLCPFCLQDLSASTVIEQYRGYFGQEYAALKRNISTVSSSLKN
jgi:wobble nucleotide-excising tRNase